MKTQIRSGLVNYVRDTYIGYNQKVVSELPIIDCSIGSSQWGISDSVRDVHDNFDVMDLCHYNDPFYKNTLIKAILNRFDCGLSENQIFCGHGSFNLAERLIHKFFIPNKMLGFGPQFNEIPSEFIAAGGLYIAIPFSLDIHEVVDHMISEISTGKYSVVYIDNPNNPTGGFLSIEELSEIIKMAEKYGTIVLVDEAYGDFVADCNSAFNLVVKYTNLVVIRSCSKGLGLAAARIGYMAISKELSDIYRKIDVPFEPNYYAASIGCVAIADNDFLDDLRKQVKNDKKLIIEKLKSLGFKILNTHEAVSIFSLYYVGANVVEFFRKRAILIEPGEVFRNTNINWNNQYCRVRIPAPSQVNEFCRRIGG
jgi:histidinol-phosphate aminotransferase